jgi:hypothetical protein
MNAPIFKSRRRSCPAPVVAPCELRMSDVRFLAWVAQAEPGDRLEYHRGFLAFDTFAIFSGLSAKERAELRQLADRAFCAAEQGLVHLVQERIDTDRFAYIAIARPKLRHAAASLSALLLDEAA